MPIPDFLTVLILLLFAAFALYLEYRLVRRYRDREQLKYDQFIARLGAIEHDLASIASSLSSSDS